MRHASYLALIFCLGAASVGFSPDAMMAATFRSAAHAMTGLCALIFLSYLFFSFHEK
jgi:hypothetical protein